MIVVAETFIKESGALPSQNLQLLATAAHEAQRTLQTWLKQRGIEPARGQSSRVDEQGDIQMVVQQICQVSVEVHS